MAAGELPLLTPCPAHGRIAEQVKQLEDRVEKHDGEFKDVAQEIRAFREDFVDWRATIRTTGILVAAAGTGLGVLLGVAIKVWKG